MALMNYCDIVLLIRSRWYKRTKEKEMGKRRHGRIVASVLKRHEKRREFEECSACFLCNTKSPYEDISKPAESDSI